MVQYPSEVLHDLLKLQNTSGLMFRRKYFLNIFNLSSRDQEGGRNKVRERRAWLFCRTHGRSWGVVVYGYNPVLGRLRVMGLGSSQAASLLNRFRPVTHRSCLQKQGRQHSEERPLKPTPGLPVCVLKASILLCHAPSLRLTSCACRLHSTREKC